MVSTHSNHVAHEVSFSYLRYFRRLPAGMAAKVPVSSVINMSTVFGANGETERFVTRYLRAQHADLFFADAAILVEGPAERMLVPNFIRGALSRAEPVLHHPTRDRRQSRPPAAAADRAPGPAHAGHHRSGHANGDRRIVSPAREGSWTEDCQRHAEDLDTADG